jgi:hypothetical protein
LYNKQANEIHRIFPKITVSLFTLNINPSSTTALNYRFFKDTFGFEEYFNILNKTIFDSL